MNIGFSELGIEKDLVEELDRLGISEPFEIHENNPTSSKFLL